MKKLLSLLSVLTISGTAVPLVIATSNYNQRYKAVIKTNGADLPTKEQIKDKLKELHPNLNINKIDITNIKESSATLNSSDKTFNFGEPLQILFSIDKSVLLDNLNKNTNLLVNNDKNNGWTVSVIKESRFNSQWTDITAIKNNEYWEWNSIDNNGKKCSGTTINTLKNKEWCINAYNTENKIDDYAIMTVVANIMDEITKDSSICYYV